MSVTPHALRRVFHLIAAYLAPSQPISYGKLVELLREVEGFERIRYADVYPILFNSQLVAEPFDPDDPLAIYYDPEAAARELLAELGTEPTA